LDYSDNCGFQCILFTFLGLAVVMVSSSQCIYSCMWTARTADEWNRRCLPVTGSSITYKAYRNISSKLHQIWRFL